MHCNDCLSILTTECADLVLLSLCCSGPNGDRSEAKGSEGEGTGDGSILAATQWHAVSGTTSWGSLRPASSSSTSAGPSSREVMAMSWETWVHGRWALFLTGSVG